MFIDLGAEQVIAAERGTEKIAVEVKTFLGPSDIHDLEQAIGQYVVYRSSLSRIEPDRALFLAVPQSVLDTLLEEQIARFTIEDLGVSLIGFEPDRELITEWKKK